MLERYLHALSLADPRDEDPAVTRDRLRDRFPKGATRRMTQLGLLVGAALDDLAPRSDDAIVYATQYGESRALEAYLDSFPTASPTLFQTSIHPSAVQQALITRQHPVGEFFPLTGRGHLVAQALQTALLSPAPRVLVCGGAALPAPLANRTLDAFGDVLYNFYGSTETGLVTVATPEDLRAAPGTIGRALHGVSVRLLGDDGAEVAQGAVGELFTRSAMLVEGYHADEGATRASMRDGHFSVGDLATVDAAGRYMIAGRRRDMVITGGVNVYPAEVEGVLDAHPAVAQSAVIGVPDEEWGERLRAFVVLRDGAPDDPVATAQELRHWCRARSSGAKVPREWAFVDGLPSNPTGKVLKRELRDLAVDLVRV